MLRPVRIGGAGVEMEIEGLSDDDVNNADVSGLNFDHLNLTSHQPVRSAVTINEHLPQELPTLDDILQPMHIPQSSGIPLAESSSFCMLAC